MNSFIEQTQKPKYIISDWLSCCPVDSDNLLIDTHLYPIADTYNQLESTLNSYFQLDGVPGLKVIENSTSTNAFLDLDLADKALKERQSVLSRVFESIQVSEMQDTTDLLNQMKVYHSKMVKTAREHMESAKDHLFNEMKQYGE